MDSTSGFDIGPGEDHRMLVNVITGYTRGEDNEIQPIYTEEYVHRPAGSRFSEPEDFSESSEISAFSSNVDSIPSRNVNMRSEHQKFQSERERLKTFEGVWRSEYNVKKEDLACEGFIYKGPGDRVMCVFCLKSIRKWDAGDVVSGEHKRLYPNCPWVRGRVDHLNKPISTTQNLKDNWRITAKGQPQSTDMKTVEDRFQSFKHWANMRRTNISVENLVKAGFFYNDVNDTVTCFHCGLTVLGRDIQDSLDTKHGQTSCPMVQSGHNATGISMDIELTESDVNRLTEESERLAAEGEVMLEGATAMDSIVEDMKSPAVQAVLTYGDYSTEDIRQAVEALKISKGSDPISSQDILQKLDPDLED